MRIVWAVDAFSNIKNFNKKANHFFANLAKKTKLTIQPVYVLNAGQLNLSAEFAGPWMRSYQPAAENALNLALKNVTTPELLPPVVLVQYASSTTNAVDTLLRFAIQFDADLVVAFTHGRSGVERLLLGSFVETLLLRSRIPVMTISPDAHIKTGTRVILFPTEFSRASRSAFRYVVDLAKALRSKIVIFHAIRHPIEPLFQSGIYLLGGAWIPIHAYFNAEVERAERRAEAWARWATGQGVEADVGIESQEIDIARAICKAADNRDVGLIAMEAQNGPFASALIGSVTRQVVRHSPRPVWVLRPNQIARARERLARVA